jgi:predicted GNAT family acetyltransferase
MTRISNTLYAKYVESRLAARIIENEQSFVIFQLVGKELFIVDMFVDDSVRCQGKARSLVHQLLKVAKENECDLITANIHVRDKGCMSTVRAAIEIGFKIKVAEQGILLIAKEVEE